MPKQFGAWLQENARRRDHEGSGGGTSNSLNMAFPKNRRVVSRIIAGSIRHGARARLGARFWGQLSPLRAALFCCRQMTGKLLVPNPPAGSRHSAFMMRSFWLACRMDGPQSPKRISGALKPAAGHVLALDQVKTGES
jgi:hypothetical protein